MLFTYFWRIWPRYSHEEGRCEQHSDEDLDFDQGAVQVAIAAAGGILPLVKRLALSAPVAQANAAGALWSLAQDVDNQVRFCVATLQCSPGLT